MIVLYSSYSLKRLSSTLEKYTIVFNFDFVSLSLSLSLAECTYRHHVELDGQFLSLDVLDTAGKVST